MRTSLALACVVLAVWVAPAASAETTVLPERRDRPGLMFVDNPAIVDAHPMPAESFSRVPGDDAVAVHFTTGTPECYGVHAIVTETAQTVTVELQCRLAARGSRTCLHHDRGLRHARGAAGRTARRPTGSQRLVTLDKHE